MKRLFIYNTMVWLVFVLTLSSAYALGPVTTGSLSPETITLCGETDFQTVSAITIYNSANQTLTDLKATLYVPKGAQVAYSPTVSLGTLWPHNYSVTMPSWTLHCNDSVPGRYTLYVNYTTNGTTASSIDQATTTLIIEGDTLEIESVSPEGTILSPFFINVTTSKSATCKADHEDDPFESMDIQLNTNDGTHHQVSLSLSDGDYTYYVRCQNQTAEAGTFVSFTVLSNPISVVQHTVNINNPLSLAELNLTTDKPGFCKMSTIARTPYTDMTGTFDITGTTTHKKTFTNLLSGTYTYYIKCQDTMVNTMANDYIVYFTVDSPPTAQITLDGENPLKEGTYTVTLTTSEEVIPSPTLTYSYDDTSKDQVDIFVPLTGNGKSWHGFMIVDKTEDRKVGAFKFSGTDFSGNTGTTITRGGIFLTDTRTPQKPINFKATPERDGSIKLSWHTPDDEIDYYRIYRSTSSNVNHLDFYDISDNTSYRDRATDDQLTYYYKVTAVSISNNEGLFSAEIAVKAEDLSKSKVEKTTTEEKLAPHLALQADSMLRKLDELQSEYDLFIESVDDHDYETVLKETSFYKELKDLNENIATLQLDVSALKETPLNESDFNFEKSRISLQIDVLEKTIPQTIELVGKETLDNNPSGEEIQAIGMEFLRVLRLESLSDKEQRTYLDKTITLQDSAEVTGEAMQFEITHLDSSTRYMTVITKEVSGDADYLIESIPKTIATTVDEISFNIPGYEKIKDDPIVRWDRNDVSKKIVYTLDKRVDLLDAHDSVSLLFNRPAVDDPVNDQTDGPSTLIGNVILKQPSFFSWETFGIILGLIVIAGLGTYYFIFMENTPQVRFHESPVHPTPYHPTPYHPTPYHPTPYRTIQHQTTQNQQTIDLGPLLLKAHKDIDSLNYQEANRVYQHLMKYRVQSPDMATLITKIKGYEAVHAISYALHNGRGKDAKEHFMNLTMHYHDLLFAGENTSQLMMYIKYHLENYRPYIGMVG